jgi:alpha-L-rhamnosidase
MRERLRERLRRRAASSHRSGATSKLLTRRLRAAAAGVLPLTLVGLTLTGAPALGAQSSRQAGPVAQASSPAPLVSSLTTEHMTDPLGIDASHPLLGWVITSAARGVVQGKYEIRVAQDESNLVSGRDLVWDSHIVDSGQSFDVPYGGPALASQTRYYWQVRVWDNHGRVSPWSRPAWFETAFLDPGQFQGSWIGQYPDSQQQNAAKGELLFRKPFTLAGRVTRARLYLAGLSYPYPDINGRPVSDHVLDTAFTEYGKAAYWQVQQGSLHAAGGEAGILKEGSDWTDYTMTFSTSIASYQSGWVVRAQSPDTNYLLILDTNDDAVGPKDALQEVVDQGGSYHVISDIPLPFAVTAGTWYAVKTVVAGSSVTTWINGMQVASFGSSNLPSGVQPIASGTVGFREDSGGEEQANFKDLSVTSPSGATLFSSPLDQASDLSAFAAPESNDGATVDYTTYDVTRLLHPGTNALAVSLGHGFYAGGADDYPSSGEPWQPTQPKLKLELDVWYANGGSAQILSDGTWKVSPGPTTADSPAAETYDARLAKPGWTQAGYDDSGWSNASVVSAPGAVLRAQLIPPIEKTATIKPVHVTEPQANTTVYDFRIITSGWARITMQGTAGTTVYIEYSEKLNPDGTVQKEGNGSTGQTDTYILKGGGPETYEPKYGWKGYRYVEVTTANPSGSSSSSSSPLPKILSVAGVVVHTALPTAGDFHSSNGLLNRMHVAMRTTILNNQYSYGSDTPVYEKGGWTNDNGDYSTSEMANFDAEAYYQHMMRNFDDSQDSAGNIGWLVPTPPGDDQVDPLWGGSFLLIEYNMFENYDDLGVIRRDYSHMAAYMDYMASLIAPTGYVYMETTWGDWSVPGNATPPSSEMLGSMFLYREAKDLAIMAAAIGNTAGASKYGELASKIRAAVNSQFYDPAFHEYYDPPGTISHARGGPNGPTGCTPGGSVPCGYDQTANVIGLAFGLAPAQDRQAIAKGLAADVVAKGNHLATGANGSKYILPMLTEAGYGDLAYQVATNPTSPGWGQWFLQCGATTMWEAWTNSTCGGVRSLDHAFMGTVDDWLFADVAGIQATSPGFRTVQIKPSPVGGLASASAYETTPLGRVSSSWARSGTSFALTAQVPVGSRASVCVPAASAQSVTESGDPVGRARGVTVIGMRGSCLQLRVGSGTYRFHSTMP